MSLREALMAKANPGAEAASPLFTANGQGMALCIETSPGEHWVLPWHLFSSAHFKMGEPERLVITFMTHAVTIRGFNLKGILPHIMSHRLESLRTAPEKYLKVGEGAPSIAQICVRPLSEPVITE